MTEAERATVRAQVWEEAAKIAEGMMVTPYMISRRDNPSFGLTIQREIAKLLRSRSTEESGEGREPAYWTKDGDGAAIMYPPGTLKPVVKEEDRAEPRGERMESGWLIERSDTKPELLLYFCFDIRTDKGITIKHWSWTNDNLKATRFGRKEDAEAAWQCMTQRLLEDVEINEHGWG